jgi:cytochrome c oxidase accessory protein FixG
MKLDRVRVGMDKFAKKFCKHFIWIVLALWTGFTFVGYFSPIRGLAAEVVQIQLGPWETFWILFYGFATYGNAGWMREQVCKHMCPYARFQSVMFDSDTLIITYDAQRGEPRGSRSRSTDYRKAGLGSCVDCGICVQACPTGIDIRDGLQYECIGCAACIDGCDQVMDKLGYPRGLIRYATENVVHGKYQDRDILRHVLRPRTLVYSAILLAAITAFVALLYQRVPLKVDVLRDRTTLVRELSDGRLENVYRLQIMNTTEAPRQFTVSATGIDGLELVATLPVSIPASAAVTLPVTLRADPANIAAGSHPVQFHVEDSANARVHADEKSIFRIPESFPKR